MDEREPTQVDTLVGPSGGTHASPSTSPPAPASSGRGGELAPGMVLDGRLRLDARIGEGAMGEIWRSRHLGLDADVAIKVVGEALRGRSSALERFWLEARTMGRMGHPNVVRVLDTSSPSAPQPYIVMELLDGEPLDVRMRRGPVDPGDAARIADGVLSALEEAHRNAIVHRDIKPANVFLGRDLARADAVKVLDFGASKLLDDADLGLTQAGALVGTPLYMSPEQASGEPVTARSDLYAVAVVFYEMLSGRLPHEADDLRALIIRRSTLDATPIHEVMPEIHPAFATFFSRALARDPEARFSDAAAMRAALGTLPHGDTGRGRARSPAGAVEAVEAVQSWGAAFDAAVSDDDRAPALADVGHVESARSASLSVNRDPAARSKIVGPAGRDGEAEPSLELDTGGSEPGARSVPAAAWAIVAGLAAAAAFGVWTWRGGTDAPTSRAVIDAGLAFVSTFALGTVIAKMR